MCLDIYYVLEEKQFLDQCFLTFFSNFFCLRTAKPFSTFLSMCHTILEGKLAPVIKAKLSSLMTAMGVLTCFTIGALLTNQSMRVELGTWLIPAQAYKMLEASFSSVPSVAQEAAKIPASLIDTQAMDQQILKSSAERQAVARYVADKYKIAHSASLEFVDKAIKVSREVDLDPTLILAVAAVESNFNPFAESNKGAQGLMQVMTRVHTDKYQLFGGHEAALDPDANMRVGSLILRQYIAKGGSLNAGLRLYVGASSVLINDGGYGKKVLAERERIRNAASTKFAYIPPATKRL
jgi:soluble lytic murein transglycosylase-like protein